MVIDVGLGLIVLQVGDVDMQLLMMGRQLEHMLKSIHSLHKARNDPYCSRNDTPVWLANNALSSNPPYADAHSATDFIGIHAECANGSTSSQVIDTGLLRSVNNRFPITNPTTYCIKIRIQPQPVVRANRVVIGVTCACPVEAVGFCSRDPFRRGVQDVYEEGWSAGRFRGWVHGIQLTATRPTMLEQQLTSQSITVRF